MMGAVDVRDVAQAHIEAATRPDACGRHIVSAREFTLLEVAGLLRGYFGASYPFPRAEVPRWLLKLVGPLANPLMTRRYVGRNVGFTLRLNNARSQTRLGLSYRPPEAAIVEHFQQLLASGVVRQR